MVVPSGEPSNVTGSALASCVIFAAGSTYFAAWPNAGDDGWFNGCLGGMLTRCVVAGIEGLPI
ncbi:MAG: hypothetical protein V9G98_21310 [Candidatus Competibacter sp.]